MDPEFGSAGYGYLDPYPDPYPYPRVVIVTAMKPSASSSSSSTSPFPYSTRPAYRAFDLHPSSDRLCLTSESRRQPTSDFNLLPFILRLSYPHFLRKLTTSSSCSAPVSRLPRSQGLLLTIMRNFHARSQLKGPSPNR